LTTALIASGALLGWLATSSRLNTTLAQPPIVPPGSQLPQPDPAFRGKIGETFADSTPSFPQPVKAKRGSPNVLIILTDDTGFGMASTFGGPAPTPTLDRLAAGGLKYNRFHTTALCSPTRAALLAGRNHHSVGTGVIIEMGTGYPGYTGIIPRSTALVSEMLRGNGYATAMFGKWHNTPEPDISPAGPFDRWPTGLGFEYFYGFNQGETHQYYPVLYRNTTPVIPPKSPEQGYHFTVDMTDETIHWINNVNAADPDKPWFAYFSTGAIHAPHHAPQEWRDKFKGKFDHGWDKQREITHAEQIRLGVIPKETKLTPRPKEIPAWDSQSADARRVYSRLMENYAAFMAHTDHEVGRLIDSLKASGELDNTLVFYIVGDNGASGEGGLEGTFSEIASLMGYNPGLAGILKRIDQIGEPNSEPHVPVGWAWATNAPFQWTKQVASHFGGTRNPMVVHWPKGIKAKGELREQFCHCIDVVPTILEAAKVAAPQQVNGIVQKPIEGISLAYSFDDAKAKSQRTMQYFEMMGNRGIYHDGWMATTRHGTPWLTAAASRGFDDDAWELYHIDEDFSQADDLATQNPAKVKELQAKFIAEAKKYDVLPLDDRMALRFDARNRVAGEPRTKWTYFGNSVMLPEPAGPIVYPNSHTVTAELTVPEKGAGGVITCAGSEGGGWSLYVLDGKLAYHYNFFDFEHSTVQAKEPLPAGKVTVKLEFASKGTPKGRSYCDGAAIRLLVNGQLAGEGEISKAGNRHSVEPFEVGRDSISPVSPDYKSKGSFPFTGAIEKITFETTQTQK
jgi:arylsulfatase